MSQPYWPNVVFQFESKPEDSFNDCDDVAEAYAVEMNDDANGGCMVWGKYHGQWLANPSSRAVVRRLLVETRRVDPATSYKHGERQ